MPICWSCYWGWPRPVADIYKKAVKDLGGDSSPLHFGPSHIVWEDENFDSAVWCLENFETYKGDYTDGELAIVKRSLEELAVLPEAIRDIVPEGYDGKDPALYPPSVEMEHCAYRG
jgi:hypothetical protein